MTIEYVLPSNTPPKEQLLPGDILKVDTSDQAGKLRRYASLLNVKRVQDDAIVFTVVPLAYGEHGNAQAGLSIKGEPPDLLNMKGKWPITDEAIGVANVAVNK